MQSLLLDTLDKITEIVTTGRLEPREVKALRQLAETLAL